MSGAAASKGWVPLSSGNSPNVAAPGQAAGPGGPGGGGYRWQWQHLDELNLSLDAFDGELDEPIVAPDNDAYERSPPKPQPVEEPPEEAVEPESERRKPAARQGRQAQSQQD